MTVGLIMGSDSDWPVMEAARSEARKMTAREHSSSVASSGRATSLRIFWYCSSGVMPRSAASPAMPPCNGAPHIRPGTTVLTLIPRGPSSRAR